MSVYTSSTRERTNPTLANYMIDFSLGMTVKAVYEVKQVDNDYFEEE